VDQDIPIEQEVTVEKSIYSIPVDYEYMGQLPIAATIVLSELAKQYNPQALMQIVEKIAFLGEEKSETAYGRDLTAYAVFLYKMATKTKQGQ
jgi:hypothetical protein